MNTQATSFPTDNDFDDDDSIIEEFTLDESVSFVNKEEERNEVKELQRRAAKETGRIRFWRIVVTTSILLTAAAVTTTTFLSLRKEEDNNFKTAVRVAFVYYAL